MPTETMNEAMQQIKKIPFPDFHAKITRFILADEPRNSKAASA